jgi:sRNA-binding carbon storage regulator CsrA
MLILARKEGERIVVTHVPSGDVMDIEVERIYQWERPDGNLSKPGVRLGFRAPREKFSVVRSEIAEKKGVDR